MKGKKFLDFIFPNSPHRTRVNVALLLGRVAFAVLLGYHGLVKMTTFSDLSNEFPNPFGLGSSLSLSLVIFAEAFCSLFILFGFLTRLATMPIIFAMLVAYIFIHGGYVVDMGDFKGGELALLYAIIFILLCITGAGKYSIDHKIHKKLKHMA